MSEIQVKLRGGVMLSSYQVPTHGQLKVTLNDIRTNYKKLTQSDNIKRTHQLDLLQQLIMSQEEHVHEMTLAALFYIEESIRLEYYYWPWPYNDPNRSALYRLTQQALCTDKANTEQQPINDTIKCTCLILLSQYLEKVKNHHPDMFRDVEYITKQFMVKIGTKLQVLLRRPPAEGALLDGFS